MDTSDSKIKAKLFFNNGQGKTKLNWFLYELALEYQMHIKDNKSLDNFRKKQGAQNIAIFCEYFAKRMKKSIFERLEKMTDETVFDEEYITDFYPKNTIRENTELLKTALKAWDTLLSFCETCPERCISERNEISKSFDMWS